MEYYIYIYLNPLKKGNYQYKHFKFDYEPFYVGLGKKNRINQHIINSRYKDKYHKHKTIKDNIILKILKNDLEPIRFKLYENVTLESAIRLEICLIKLIGRRNIGLGTLANLTDGGEGCVGCLWSNDARKKHSDLIRTFWKNGIFDNRDICGDKNGFYDMVHSEETKQKIRETIGDSRIGDKNANYGNKWTDEEKQNASLRQIKNHKHLTGDNNPAKNEEVRKKISNSKLGLKNPNAKKWVLISPDGKENIIEGGIKRNLKLFKLDYQQFKKVDNIRMNKNGWILKEF
jgi:hypothetical protein